jgi:hypothetical protein
MTSKRLTIAAIALTLVFILYAAAVPAVWFAAQDKTLLSEPMNRLRADGRLAPEGEDLYIVRTLHARSALLQQQGPSGGYQSQNVTSEVKGRLFLVLDEMAKAGVMPLTMHTLLQEELLRPGVQWRYSVDTAGFEQIQCLLPKGGRFTTFGVEIEPRIRWVVHLWVMNPEGAQNNLGVYDAGEGFEAYLEWLQLNQLGDWENANLSGYNIQKISQNGLLQAYITTNRGIEIGITPLNVSV